MLRAVSFARPEVILRWEAGITLVVACCAYQQLFPHHWGLFALLFLAPDVALLAYVAGKNPRGAVLYNLCHSEVFPLLFLLFAMVRHNDLFSQLALIWLSHIGFDRLLGYGLKFPTFFRFTHIQSAGALAGAPADAR